MHGSWIWICAVSTLDIPLPAESAFHTCLCMAVKHWGIFPAPW